MIRSFLTAIILVSTLASWAGGIDKAFEALSIYDYFKARQLFYTSLKKNPGPAGFGLATIYFRNDNPFHNLDSAFKYIDLGQNHYTLAKPASRQELIKFGITDSSFARLHDSICYKAYLKYMRNPGPENAERYMQVYHSSALAYRVMCMRDSFIFHRPDRKLSAEGFTNYIETYPQSCFINDVRNLLEFAIYMETTAEKNDKAYLTYIEKYPKGKYLPYAKEELLNYYIKTRSATGIYSFIKNYGANYPTTLAWNMLLGIEAPHHSKTELEGFLTKYNDYPKREEIMEEFTYWQTPMFLIKRGGDKMGYCDSTGKQLIEPHFADAADFSEGYAAVQKDELYGYINKAGKTKIDFVYTEASDFINNVAIVQKDRKYFLIDYSNKMLSGRYDEIADFSEGMAIVKKNNLYGAINLNGQEIVKPSYEMMSDYAEGMAVILKNGKYGFADKQGFVAIAPIYDWVASFRNGQCRAQYNKLFGVINKKGDFVIQPSFDLIDEMHNGVYLLMKENLYGFADSSGCFITEIKYNFQPSYKTSMLSDGRFLRLYGNKKQELHNINGGKYFTDHVFEETSLPVNNLFVAREKGKCSVYSLVKPGFSKRSLQDAWTDGKFWYLLNKKGLAVFDIQLEKNLFTVLAGKAQSFGRNYFLLENEEGKGLCDSNGSELLPMAFDEIKTTSQSSLLYLEKNEKGAYFNLSARTFVWKEEGFE